MREIIQMAHDVIEDAGELGILKAPLLFRGRLSIKKGRGEGSWGGIKRRGNTQVPALSFASGWVAFKNKSLEEYASIRKDPVIGDYFPEDSYKATKALVCHEVAHAIQYWNWHRGGEKKAERPKPHGHEWRVIYRALRSHYGLVRGEVL